MELELSPMVLVVLAAAAFLIGLAKGGFAGGLGPFVTVLVSAVIPARQAIGVLLPMLMVGDVLAFWVHRRDWSRPAVTAMLPAGVLGVVFASVFLGAASDRLVELVLAVLSIAFVAYRLLRPRLSVGEEHAGRGMAALAGGVSGVTSTVAHAGGPPVSIYLLAARTPPVTFAATAAVYFFAVNWLKVPGYAVAGLLDLSIARTLPLALLLVPGTLVGRWLVERIRQEAFERIVLVLLTLGAVNLLIG